MAEWQNVGMAEWQNGRIAEWQNGRMAEWQNHWQLDTTRLVSRVVGEPIIESRVVGEPLYNHIRIRMCELACVNAYLPLLVLTTLFPPV